MNAFYRYNLGIYGLADKIDAIYVGYCPYQLVQGESEGFEPCFGGVRSGVTEVFSSCHVRRLIYLNIRSAGFNTALGLIFKRTAVAVECGVEPRGTVDEESHPVEVMAQQEFLCV